MKLPTKEQCTFTLTVEQDDSPVEFDSGEPSYDAQDKEETLAQLDKGNIWAWALVCVTCSYGPIEGTDYLGQCNYPNEESFRDDGYADMCDAAYQDMCAQFTKHNLTLL